MKKVLILMVAVLSVASVSFADNISVYSDCTGSNCELAPNAFTTSAGVVHKFSLGATGSRFKVAGTGIAGAILAFNTPFVPVGNINTDLSLGYGSCQVGSFCLGTLIMQTSAGGVIDVLPADTFTNVLYTDCNFAELSATGGRAYVGTSGPCPNPTAQSTWGQVKSLYR